MAITTKPFGKTADGKEITEYTLTNHYGASLSAINFGGIVTSIKVPDKNGHLQEVTLGYNHFLPYTIDNGNLGALIGRYGNRIGKSKFTLKGKTIALSKNEGDNHLHGGDGGYNIKYWNITPKEYEKEDKLVLSLLSPHGEGGYPGNLAITVTYTWDNDNNWHIDYKATSDADTIVNLTQHSYFNLSGDEKEDILGHVLQIKADAITLTDKELITTGEFLDVANTPYDFRTPAPIGQMMNTPGYWDQLVYGKGYDFNYVLSPTQNSPHVIVYSPLTAIQMTVTTSEPGVQLYTGNQLNCQSRSGKTYNKHHGFCLETQHYPDSPNKPHFPSVAIEKGETYHTQTTYGFSIKA